MLVHATGKKQYPVFMAYEIHADLNKVIVASFIKCDSPSEFSQVQILDDSIASAYLSNLGGGQITQIFTAKQLGSVNPDVEYYWLRSLQTFQLGAPEYGPEEKRGMQSWVMNINFEGVIGYPYNKYVVFKNSKDTNLSSQYKSLNDGSPCLSIFLPFEDSTFEDGVLTLAYSEDHGFRCNIPATEVSLEELHGPRRFSPGVKFLGPNICKANESIELWATITKPDGKTEWPNAKAEVYLENTGGYISRQRVLANPTCKFTFRALDLEPGDEVKIKAGWRNFSGLSEHIIKVV